MVEAKAVGGKKKMKKSKEGKGGMRKLAAIGAALVLVVAIAVTYNHAYKHKSCHCSQVLFMFFFHLLCALIYICIVNSVWFD